MDQDEEKTPPDKKAISVNGKYAKRKDEINTTTVKHGNKKSIQTRRRESKIVRRKEINKNRKGDGASGSTSEAPARKTPLMNHRRNRWRNVNASNQKDPGTNTVVKSDNPQNMKIKSHGGSSAIRWKARKKHFTERKKEEQRGKEKHNASNRGKIFKPEEDFKEIHLQIQKWNDSLNNDQMAVAAHDASQTLIKLLHHGDLGEEFIFLLMEFFSRISKSTYQQIKISILAMLHDSIFLKEHIPNVLLSFQIDFEEKKKLAFLESLVYVTRECMVKLPSQVKEMSLIIDRLIVYSSKNHLQENNDMLFEKINVLQSLRDETVNERIQEKMVVRNNQHEQPLDNYKELTSYPSSKDLLANRRPFLRPVIPRGAYNDGAHYLDIQFRLLKEDLVAPLREGMQAVVEGKTKIEAKYYLKKYDEIRKEEICYDKRNGVLHKISFNTKKIHPQFWSSPKHLKFGSLLCFSKDVFNTVILAVITDNHNSNKNQNKQNQDSLRKGQLKVKFLNIHIVEEYFKGSGNEMIMVECPSFFEAYKHVLDGIKEIDEGNVPFASYIVNGVSEEKVPEYCSVIVQDVLYDLKCILSQSEVLKKPRLVNILDQSSWPLDAETCLNESQMKAFQYTLTNKLSVIQGPPGTGKTFIGLMIAQALLLNKEYWNGKRSTPMLVVCFTNHALDQFLLGLVSKGFKKIVRVGSRYCEELEKFSLYNAKRRCNFSRENIWYLKEVLEDLCDELTSDTMYLERIEDPNFGKLIELDEMKDVMLAKHRNFFQYLDNKAKKKKSSLMEIFLEIANISVRDLDDPDDWRKENDEEETTDLNEIYGRKTAYSKEVVSQTEELHEMSEQKVASNQEKKKLIKRNMRKHHRKIDANKVKSPWTLSIEEKWSLYKHWFSRYKRRKHENLSVKKEIYNHRCNELQECEDEEIEKVLKQQDVIAMTTTAAAKKRNTLRNIKPKIVIIEEAAEVLEAHVLTSITMETQHLILIGDHKQLRPSVQVYELEKKYNFDVSLFERLINNGVAYNTLDTQHRMRPEISRLVRHIYPGLKDHEDVLKYPHIKGVTKDVVFITHTKHEQENAGLQSKENDYEAAYLAALCRYLLQQGYKPNQITVLTGYTAQMLKLKSKMSAKAFEGVRIAVVDNFQGEENDIILLSLVRSNGNGSIGFLQIENRICVALSRAKHGLYVIGNFDLLESRSSLWKIIVSEVRELDCLQSTLELRCQNHLLTSITIKLPEDFKLEAPFGGCQLRCEARLDCGHSCPEGCHVVDSEHENKFKCKKNCGLQLQCGHKDKCDDICHFGKECYCQVMVEKELPSCEHIKKVECSQDLSKVKCNQKCSTEMECGHLCRKKCHVGETCDPCQTVVEKIIPDCGHAVKTPCSTNEKRLKCITICTKELSCLHECNKICHFGRDCDEDCKLIVQKILACNHKQNAQCFMDPGDVECKCECTTVRSCGHMCPQNCHFPTPCDPCKAKVPKKLPRCGHTETVKCYKLVEDIECNQKCLKVMSCGHMCQARCHKGDINCGPCNTTMEKEIIACGHKQYMTCSEDPSQVVCQSPCLKIKKCDHQCLGKCGQPCVDVKCKSSVKVLLPCKHETVAPCFKEVDEIFCQNECEEALQCLHTCIGKCGSCKRGRLHVRCLEACGKKLPCLHDCDEPCALICLPCKQKCENKCSHSKCSEKCGNQCIVCTESCTWNCEHYSCSKQCSELCDREPCNEPCQKVLNCGHTCIGLCGENCLKFCRICQKIELDRMFTADVVANGRFVELIDCNHIFEVKELDKLMMANDIENNSLRGCPTCKKPIRRSWRYGNIVKSALLHIEHMKKNISECEEINVQLKEQIEEKIQEVASSNFGGDPILPIIQQMLTERRIPQERVVKAIINRSNKHIFVLTSLLLRKHKHSVAGKRHLLLLMELYQRFMKVYPFFTASKSPKKLHNDVKKLQRSIENPAISNQQISGCHVELKRLWLHKKINLMRGFKRKTLDAALAALDQGKLIAEDELDEWIGKILRCKTMTKIRNEQEAERAITSYRIK